MRSAARFVLTTPLSSFRLFSLSSFLPSLANYAVFIIAETSKQNVTFGHGSVAGAGATGFVFNSEERGKELEGKALIACG